MPYDICGLGNALMDVLVQLESDLPIRALDLKKGTMHLADEAEWHRVFEAVQHLPHETHPGGSCANVISTTALLGARATFCGQVGHDRFGRIYAEALGGYCGEHHLHLHPDGHTGKCLSLITPDAERTLVTTLGCAIELEPENLFSHVIPGSRYLHVTGYLFTGGRMGQTARAALELARSSGVKVSFDVSDPWVVGTHRALIWEIIDQYADVVFTNAAEAEALCGKPAEEAAEQLAEHCEIAVVKLGHRGSVIRTGRRSIPIDVHRVTALDTTGAGDAYAGGFLYGLIQGYDLERCGRIGSRVAAETVTQTGAVVTAPGRLSDIIQDL
jgi:sugar/nucleoside kinase (ribokinase family)